MDEKHCMNAKINAKMKLPNKYQANYEKQEYPCFSFFLSYLKHNYN